VSGRKKLTKGQERVYKAIVQYMSTHGYPPSYKDLGDNLGVSSTCVKTYLDIMERERWLRRTPGLARTIVLLPESEDKKEEEES